MRLLGSTGVPSKHSRQQPSFFDTGAEHLFCRCRIPSDRLAGEFEAVALIGGGTRVRALNRGSWRRPSIPLISISTCTYSAETAVGETLADMVETRSAFRCR